MGDRSASARPASIRTVAKFCRTPVKRSSRAAANKAATRSAKACSRRRPGLDRLDSILDESARRRTHRRNRDAGGRRRAGRGGRRRECRDDIGGPWRETPIAVGFWFEVAGLDDVAHHDVPVGVGGLEDDRRSVAAGKIAAAAGAVIVGDDDEELARVDRRAAEREVANAMRVRARRACRRCRSARAG